MSACSLLNGDTIVPQLIHAVTTFRMIGYHVRRLTRKALSYSIYLFCIPLKLCLATAIHSFMWVKLTHTVSPRINVSLLSIVSIVGSLRD